MRSAREPLLSPDEEAGAFFVPPPPGAGSPPRQAQGGAARNGASHGLFSPSFPPHPASAPPSPAAFSFPAGGAARAAAPQRAWRGGLLACCGALEPRLASRCCLAPACAHAAAHTHTRRLLQQRGLPLVPAGVAAALRRVGAQPAACLRPRLRLAARALFPPGLRAAHRRLRRAGARPRACAPARGACAHTSTRF
jgi:hypothetical protein